MTMFLVGVDFDAPVALPGKRAESTFPPPTVGWAGFAGWRMYVEDGRLCIVSPPGEATLNKAAQAEVDANGIDVKDVSHLVSIPLHRCTLRYAGTPGEVCSEAPSPALAKPAPKPAPIERAAAPVPAAPVAPTERKKPGPKPQPNAPQPLRRGPPGAKPMVVPPVSTEIEVDGEAPKHKRSVPALSVEPQ